jgi:hypothetical protein
MKHFRDCELVGIGDVFKRIQLLSAFHCVMLKKLNVRLYLIYSFIDAQRE